MKATEALENHMTEAYVYLLTNDRNTVLYAGSTNNLRKRVYHHKNRLVPGFTKKYNIGKLVYFEVHPDMTTACARERQIKGYNRDKKNGLINAMNNEWADLYDDLQRN
jgi:putative endonuclease